MPDGFWRWSADCETGEVWVATATVAQTPYWKLLGQFDGTEYARVIGGLLARLGLGCETPSRGPSEASQ